MILELLAGALQGVSHPNTDLDAQTFLLRVRQLRAEAGADPNLPVGYRPQVTSDELDDPQVLIWDIGRRFDPDHGNFDHHQDHNLGATPIILLEALGRTPSELDRYVDLGDRGYFYKHPQPHPHPETLHGIAAGINLIWGEDDVRSVHYQDLLTWVEQAGVDPFGRFPEQEVPERFHPFMRALRAEEREAEQVAVNARWFVTPLGKVAYIQTHMISVTRALYRQGAVLVIQHEPHGHMSGWSRPGPKFTVAANPAAIAIPEQLDLRPLFARLSSMESEGLIWGGQAGIGGSPREDGGSGISAERVIREVLNYVG